MVRIVFFGTPAFSVPTLERLLAAPYPVVGVVTQPDRPRGRGHQTTEAPVKQLARTRGIPVLQPEKLKDPAFLDSLAALEADLGVVAAYGKMLPDAVLTAPRRGLINVHASLLPKYRGAAPVHRAIMAGEQQTGITIIRLVREMDAGPMLASEARAIGPEETSDAVERDLAQIGAALLVRSVADLDAGRAREVAQDERGVTFAPRLTKQDGLIDWNEPASAVHNRVRGLHPWPHAYTFLGEERYVILHTAVCQGDEVPEPRTGLPCSTPGQVLEARGDRLIVAAGHGSDGSPSPHGSAVAILQIQPEGRRALATREFLAGHRIAPASTFRSSPG